MLNFKPPKPHFKLPKPNFKLPKPLSQAISPEPET